MLIFHFDVSVLSSLLKVTYREPRAFVPRCSRCTLFLMEKSAKPFFTVSRGVAHEKCRLEGEDAANSSASEEILSKYL